MTLPKTKSNVAEEDLLFRILRQLDQAPEASQRSIATALGISLGRLNTQLRAAAEAGFIKISERSGPDRRQIELAQETKDIAVLIGDRFGFGRGHGSDSKYVQR